MLLDKDLELGGMNLLYMIYKNWLSCGYCKLAPMGASVRGHKRRGAQTVKLP
jgi:hypothetical protein